MQSSGETVQSDSLFSLLQPLGGLFTSVQSVIPGDDELQIAVRLVQGGNAGVAWSRGETKRLHSSSIQGVGSGLTEEEALVPALAEGLERYCTGVVDTMSLLVASANELGDDALDLEQIPRSSAVELGHSRCPLKLPDKTQPIRWVRGVSLLDGNPLYLPAVMAYSHIGTVGPGEKFWLPISTGCAAHTNYTQAIIRGIYEVIERDAISILWLQKLALPEIDIEDVWEELPQFRDLYNRSSQDVCYRVFDATSDLGVPTIYGLQLTPWNPSIHQLVACSSGFSLVDAVAKVLKDFVALRPAFRRPKPVPEHWDDFTDLLHGATYMAHPSRAEAFNFLTRDSQTMRLTRSSKELSEDAALTAVLARLRKLRMEAFVVDLSSDEALRAGMRVVRVIIPALQPLSFRYRARYLGHPRLFEAPARMGYPVLSEQNLNQWPQPFA